MAEASGSFEVETVPIADDTAPGRISISKQFSGDLAGTSTGQMLTALTPTQGSMAYVAVEQVSGTLGGRDGSFTLVHTGVMDRGASQLRVAVVPDSGTEELLGLSGTMAIDIVDGEHRYRFDYDLSPRAPAS